MYDLQRKEIKISHSLDMKLRSKLLIAAGCVAIIAAVFLWEVYRPARQARSYLSELAGIVPGKTREAELLSKAVFRNTHRQCSEGDCEYAFMAWNSGLSDLHLAPNSVVGVIVRVKDGMVTEVWASASVFAPAAAATTALQEVAANGECGMKPCIRQLRPVQKTKLHFTHTTIIFDSNAGLHNHLSEAINPDCLHRLGGCTDPVEFAPVLKDTSSFIQIKSWPPAAAIRMKP